MRIYDLKVLIIGGGAIAKRHISNLQFLGVNNITVLKRNYSQSFSEKFNVKVITFLNQSNDLFDLTIVCTPTSLHFEGIQIGKKLNTHIFVEKPLTHDVLTLELIKKMEFNDKLFFIGFMLRFHPFVNQIKILLESKIIGEWYSARFEFGSWLPDWHPWENYKEGYAARIDLGGGVINTICHELDLMIHFFGEPSSVKGFKKNTRTLGIDVEEIAEMIFEYEKGVVSIHLDYLQKKYDRRVRILGTNGSIDWLWNEKKIIVNTNEEIRVIEEDKNFDLNQLYINELNYFIKCILRNSKNENLNFNYSILHTYWMLKMHEFSK